MSRATVSVKVHKQRTLNALDRIIGATLAVTPGAVEECADQTRRDTVAALWRKKHPPGTPTPSQPGEPPAKISGDLARSIRSFTAVQEAEFTWSSQVGPTSPPAYGRIQELGGACGRGHQTHLPPRPYLSPQVVELLATGFYESVFRDWWRQALRAG